MPFYYSCNEIVRHLYVPLLISPPKLGGQDNRTPRTEPDGNDVLWEREEVFVAIFFADMYRK